MAKLVKLTQNQTINNFFHEDISHYNNFENSNDYQSKHDAIRYDQ